MEGRIEERKGRTGTEDRENKGGMGEKGLLVLKSSKNSATAALYFATAASYL